ncbi:MAG: hypothetical protein HWN67_02660 [Candidatus Helarchaeota archaeon]|nr:hypothetical protein [Candidatus Helarchaeota archaeon]
MTDTVDKIQRFFEEICVILVPLLIVLVIIGGMWAVVDSATADPFDDLINGLLGTGGVLGFFTNLPSDGLRILLIGAIITAIFGIASVIAITAKDGRRFWYKLLFRKEPPV